MGSIEKNISSDIFFSMSRTGCWCRPGGHALVELHVEPPPQLRVAVKLDGAGVVAQEPQLPLPCHGEGVSGVEHRVWTQSPHCDVAHCHVQPAYRAKGEHASLTDTMQIKYS